MLQLNKLKTILPCVCILFSTSLFAQSGKTTEKNTIVMTKTELASLLKTVADARKAQLMERQSGQVKQDLAELRENYQQRPTMQNFGYDGGSNQQILNELRYLNQRVDNMGQNNNGAPSRNRDNSTYILPGNSGSSQGYLPNTGSSTTLVPSNNNKIKDLESKIDSLRNAKPTNVKGESSLKDSLDRMNSRLMDVRRSLDSLEMKMTPPGKTVKKNDSGEKTYFKQQVYFANNSEKLSADYFESIKEFTQILKTYPEAKVLMEGWASPIGKSDYNKQLSMRRAESVETAFMENGIAKNRLIVSFRGEDKSSSEQNARRVDMSVIVR